MSLTYSGKHFISGSIGLWLAAANLLPAFKKQTVINSTSIKESILPPTWWSLKANLSLVESPDENAAWPTLWLQSFETLNRKPS